MVTTHKGTLLALCDARVEKPGDAPNNIDLALKRSVDNGETCAWAEQTTISHLYTHTRCSHHPGPVRLRAEDHRRDWPDRCVDLPADEA